MLIRLLRVVIYRERWASRIEDIADPTWDDIEVSIRRLDRFYRPTLLLFRQPHAEEDELADFTVTGGESRYAFECVIDSTEYSYFDPTHGDEQVPIWLSDQGAEVEATRVCYAIDTVLKAARYFCDHGLPDPELTWQTRQLP